MANVQQIFVFIVDKPASLFIPNSFFMQNLVYPTDAKEFHVPKLKILVAEDLLLFGGQGCSGYQQHFPKDTVL